MLRFPDTFLFGAATSSHQVEGGNTRNDWHDWERQPGRIRDGTTSGEACGWWAGRAEEDLALAASLGHNAHRLSLEWSRLEPEPGRYDAAAFGRYRDILRAGRSHGLRLLVTLNHFTLPRWAAARGGWLHGGLPERFEAYAVEALKQLGDEVDLWATLNEPSVLAYMGYAGRRWPPGLEDPWAALVALRHMLEAHARGYRAMHRHDDSVVVGLIHNAPRFDGAVGALDRAIAATRDWAFSGVLLHALRTGWLLPPLAAPARRLGHLAGSLDYCGLNFYGRYRVAFDPAVREGFFGRHVQWPTIRTDWTDWGEPWPEGLLPQLTRLSRLDVPLYVTENGIYDNHDTVRGQFLVDHLRALHDAICRGLDVRGYFHWSLIDNFEWAEGWSTHFGLVELDRANQGREPKGSAHVYERICRQRAVSPLAV